MKLMKFSLIILFCASQAFAGGVGNYMPAQQANTATGPTQESIYDAAAQTKKQNETAQKQAQMISSALNSAGTQIVSACCGTDNCSARCPVGITLLVMSAMASQQAGSHGGTASGAGMTMGATDAFSYDKGRVVGADGAGFSQAGEEIAKKLVGSGVKFDGTKFSAKGFSAGAKDVSSDSAMSAAGLSKAAIASIKGEIDKANTAAAEKYKLTTPNFGFEEGGGGGSGAYGKGGPGGAGDGSVGSSGLNSGRVDMSSMDAKGAVSGLTKNYNGDPIGVANDSIFNMMTRRYQLKDRQETFFDSKAAIKN